MEEFKFEIYSTENQNKQLEFEQVNKATANKLGRYIQDILGYDKTIDPSEFFGILDRKLLHTLHLDDVNDLEKVFQSTNEAVSVDQNCFLIWKYPHDIDRVELSHLILNWDYYWYPESDEAVAILLERPVILILLTHYGLVKYETASWLNLS